MMQIARSHFFYRKLFFILLFLCASLGLINQGFAQELRGQIEQEDPLYIPTENFPGYFDSNVLPGGKVSFNLPFGSLSLGLTKNLTVSLNVPLVFYMVERWTPTFLGEVRYRFFSNTDLSSTLTVYGGYFSYKDSEDDLKISFLNATYNNSITLTDSHVITTQVGALAGQYQNQSVETLSFDKKNVNAITFGLGYTYIFNRLWSLETVFAFPLYTHITSEDMNSVGSVEFKHIKNFPLFFQSHASWKISQDSLLTFGGFFLTQTDINFIILPWISWTVIF